MPKTIFLDPNAVDLKENKGWKKHPELSVHCCQQRIVAFLSPAMKRSKKLEDGPKKWIFWPKPVILAPKKATLADLGQKMTCQAVDLDGAPNFNVSKATPGCGQGMLCLVQFILVAKKNFHNSSIEKKKKKCQKRAKK